MASRPAETHVDWLRVLAVHGPFLSLPVLLRAMPEGPEPLPSGERPRLRERLDLVEQDVATPREFAEYLLHDFLGYGREAVAWQDDPRLTAIRAVVETHRVELRPTAAVFDGEQPVLLVLATDRRDQGLDRTDRDESCGLDLMTAIESTLEARTRPA